MRQRHPGVRPAQRHRLRRRSPSPPRRLPRLPKPPQVVEAKRRRRIARKARPPSPRSGSAAAHSPVRAAGSARNCSLTRFTALAQRRTPGQRLRNVDPRQAQAAPGTGSSTSPPCATDRPRRKLPPPPGRDLSASVLAAVALHIQQHRSRLARPGPPAPPAPVRDRNRKRAQQHLVNRRRGTRATTRVSSAPVTADGSVSRQIARRPGNVARRHPADPVKQRQRRPLSIPRQNGSSATTAPAVPAPQAAAPSPAARSPAPAAQAPPTRRSRRPRRRQVRHQQSATTPRPPQR